MITGVVLAKNEEENIEKCLESLRWCDELVVIDDNSTDKTVEIAKKCGATVFAHDLDDDFAGARNFALSQAKGEWVLFVDADEVVSKDLAKEIREIIQNSLLDGAYVKRVDHVFGKTLKYGETGNSWLLRLGRKDAGSWTGTVHEKWNIQNNITDLQNPLLHYPHKNLSEFLKKINFYTTLRAKELYDQKARAGFFSIIFYTKAKFFQNYIIKLGILDGMPGLIHAFCMSFHSFLVRGKLWQLSDKK